MVLFNLLEAFRTMRMAEPQVLLRAQAITLELNRANAEFRLLVWRQPIQYGKLSLRLDHVLPTLGVWLHHPATRCAFPFRRLTRDKAPTYREYT
ncbi:hypothetical protein MRX96_040072 [Rhipicephalus microplus]